MLGDPDFLSASMLLRALFGGVLGAVIGSFLATILVRWPEGRSVVSGRSACDGCGTQLRPVELVPILSHLAQAGKCRRCGAQIDAGHMRVEIGGAVIGFAAFALQTGTAAIATATLGWWLLLLALLDHEHFWLPDRLTLPLLPAGLAVAALGIGPPLPDRLIGAAAGLLVLWGIAAAYERLRGRVGLGGGDPKLFGALGAWLGWQHLPLALAAAAGLGLFIVLLMRLRGREVRAHHRLPLGTLLAAAAFPIWIGVLA